MTRIRRIFAVFFCVNPPNPRHPRSNLESNKPKITKKIPKTATFPPQLILRLQRLLRSNRLMNK